MGFETVMNKYVWELYLKSGGQEVVEFFEDNLVNGFKDEYVDKSELNADNAKMYEVMKLIGN